MTLLDPTNAAVIDLKSTTTRLIEIFTSLETLPVNSLMTYKADNILLRLLQSLDDLPSATDLREILAHLPVSCNFQGQETVVMTITEIRN